LRALYGLKLSEERVWKERYKIYTILMKLRNKVYIFIHIEKKIYKQEKISIQRLLIENKDLSKSFLFDEGSLIVDICFPSLFFPFNQMLQESLL
jgi:hypothetical protein